MTVYQIYIYVIACIDIGYTVQCPLLFHLDIRIALCQLFCR